MVSSPERDQRPNAETAAAAGSKRLSPLLNNPEFAVEELRERVPKPVVSNVPEIRLTTLGDDVVMKRALASAMTAGTGDPGRLREEHSRE